MLRVVGLLAFVSSVSAWGPEGHEIVANIAESLSSDGAKNWYTGLLKKDNHEKLSDVAAWADSMRGKWPWSEPLHFIDLPDNQCHFDWEKDCHDQHGNKNFCVAGSIQNYTNRLADTNLPEDERIIALKMLVHVVGDVHQPLHVGFTSDRGGNTEKVTLNYDRKMTKALHAVWDTEIIVHHEYEEHWRLHDWEAVAEDLKKKFLEPNTSNAYNEFGCTDYTIENPHACYFDRAEPVVERRLVAGGVRLKQILEAVFTSLEDSNDRQVEEDESNVPSNKEAEDNVDDWFSYEWLSHIIDSIFGNDDTQSQPAPLREEHKRHHYWYNHWHHHGYRHHGYSHPRPYVSDTSNTVIYV